MLLLNKLYCLDKGWVASVSCTNNFQQLKTISLEDGVFNQNFEHFINKEYCSFLIRCPIFVQLALSKYGFNITSITSDKIEAFIPDVSQIKSGNHEQDVVIADDLTRTTEALLINPKAYQHDNCDRFVSQVITPISVYTTIFINGSLDKWVEFYKKQKDMPFAIDIYRQNIQELIYSNYNDLRILDGQEKI